MIAPFSLVYERKIQEWKTTFIIHYGTCNDSEIYTPRALEVSAYLLRARNEENEVFYLTIRDEQL